MARTLYRCKNEYCDELIYRHMYCSRLCFRTDRQRGKSHKCFAAKCFKHTKNAQYCSVGCANSVLKVKTNTKPRNCCRYCGNLTLNALFCSIAHQHDMERERTLKIAQSIGYVPFSIGAIRDILTKTYGYKCSLDGCNLDEWRGAKILLIVDHIDGNASHHELSNLRFVCSNCDATLPTYKARNAVSSRTQRRTKRLV